MRLTDYPYKRTFWQLKGWCKKSKRLWHMAKDFVGRYVVGCYKGRGMLGAYHWIRCHVWNRYHIIDLSRHGSPSESYRWGWIDRDNAMFLACFLLLKDYVEQEDPKVGLRTLDDYAPHSRDWYEGEREGVERQLVWAKEVRALYDWWKTERKREHDEVHAAYLRDAPGWCRNHDKLEERDEEMLMRLVKVRGHLWT